MRYRLTNGVIDYFKSVYDKVIYAKIEDAYEEYEDTMQITASDDDIITKYPALVAISRTGSTPKPHELTWLEMRNGGYVNTRRVEGSKSQVATINWEVNYDVTVLSSQQMITDTLVEELLMYIASNPSFTYDSGYPSVNDHTQTIRLKSSIQYTPGALGEMYENEDATENGTIFRTTFSIVVATMTMKYSDGIVLNAKGSEVTIDFLPVN